MISVILSPIREHHNRVIELLIKCEIWGEMLPTAVEAAPGERADVSIFYFHVIFMWFSILSDQVAFQLLSCFFHIFSCIDEIKFWSLRLIRGCISPLFYSIKQQNRVCFIIWYIHSELLFMHRKMKIYNFTWMFLYYILAIPPRPSSRHSSRNSVRPDLLPVQSLVPILHDDHLETQEWYFGNISRCVFIGNLIVISHYFCYCFSSLSPQKKCTTWYDFVQHVSLISQEPSHSQNSNFQHWSSHMFAGNGLNLVLFW